ncbi:MAG: hypothetical protein ACOZNI_29610 [Myxococcota bacterium]
MKPPRLRFLPSLRRGLTPLAGEGGALRVTVDGRAAPDLRLRGPGDVAGLDPAVFARVVPADGGELPVGRFAAVELSAPDLPWRHSPPPRDGRLVPWLALAVVREATVTVERTEQGAVLDFAANAGAELPDPAEAWAWAHVQAAVAEGESVADALAARPEGFCARLLSSRRLLPDTAWIAAVVPVYAAGVAAALGGVPDDPWDATWAWSKDTGPLRLPAYFTWRFRTRDAGDAEALVRALEVVRLPATAGTRPLALVARGVDLAGAPALRFGGVLSASPEPNPPLPAAAAADLRRQLVPAGDTPARPRVHAPVYGATATGVRDPAAADAPLWLEEVNADPAMRAAAGAGASVVRARQEELAAEVWDALRGVREAAGRRARARAAGTLAERLAGRLARASDGALVQVTRPTHGRVVSGTASVSAALDTPTVPAGLVSGPLRRLARPTGSVAKGAVAKVNAISLTRRVASGAVDAASLSARLSPAGLALLTEEAVTGKRASVTFERARAPATAPRASETVAGSIRAGTWSASFPTYAPRAAPPRRDTAIEAAAAALRGALAGAAGRAEARAIARAGDGEPRDVHVALRLGPALAALDPRLLFDGVDDLPEACVTVLRMDTRVAEAAVLGFEHELASELAWRGAPAPPTGTRLAAFWEEGDVPAVRDWTGTLGAHLGDRAPALVLLLRGPLVERLPGVRVFVEAPDRGRTRLSRRALAPATFQIHVDGRTLVAGLPTDDPDASVVLAEPMSGPGFGLDAEPDAAAAGWDGLAWTDVATRGDHVDVGATALAAATRDGVTWGADGAQQARILFQRPVSLHVALSLLLPKAP